MSKAVEELKPLPRPMELESSRFRGEVQLSSYYIVEVVFTFTDGSEQVKSVILDGESSAKPESVRMIINAGRVAQNPIRS
jgi:hypothetical protein